MNTLTAPHQWVEKDLRPRFPLLADNALEAYEIATQAGIDAKLSSADLSRLEEFCLSRSSMLRDWALEVIGALAQGFPSAAELLLRFAAKGRADVAVSAVAALHNLNNLELFQRVVSNGLRHKSKKVRELSASKILTFEMTTLFEQLEYAVSSETDAECKKSLEFSFNLVKDGYVVTRLDSGEIYVTVAMGRGLCSQLFTEQKFHEIGLASILESIKS